MSKYRITMDGKVYEMEVELMGADEPVKAAAKAAPAPVPAAAPVAAAKPAEAPKAAAPAAAGGAVVSPMPGTVLRILAAKGDAVSQGQAVMVVEAMKMENEIVAPVAGKVAELYVAAGDSVQSGAPLFTIGE